MTKEETVEYIKVYKRFPKNFWSMADYAFALLLPLPILVLGIVLLYTGIFKNKLFFLQLYSPVLICIGIVLLRLSIIRLRENIQFKTIQCNKLPDIKKLGNMIQEEFRIEGINIDEKLGLIEVATKWSAFSWGEELMLVANGNEMLINSRPSQTSNQPFTFNRDRNNVKKLTAIIESNF